MDIILSITFFLSIIAIFIGVIKPSIVIRWKDKATRKDVFKVYGAVMLVSFLMLPIFIEIDEKKEVTQEVQEQKIEQVKKETKKPVSKIEKNKNITINAIRVSDYSFTKNGKQAVNIMLKQDSLNYIDLTITKDIIKKGYVYNSSEHTGNKYPIDISAYYNNGSYNFYSSKNTLKLTIKEYNQDTKEAIIIIYTTLNNVDNNSDTIVLKDFKFTLKDKNFDLLTKYYKEVEKPKVIKKLFKITPKEYINKINTSFQTLESPLKFKVDKIENNSLTVSIDKYIAISIGYDKDTNKIENFVFIAGGKPNATHQYGIDIAMCTASLVMGIEDPYMSIADKRGKIVNSLLNLDGVERTLIKKDIKFTGTFIKNIGFVITGVPLK